LTLRDRARTFRADLEVPEALAEAQVGVFDRRSIGVQFMIRVPAAPALGIDRDGGASRLEMGNRCAMGRRDTRQPS
jgi:hypothetical protein